MKKAFACCLLLCLAAGCKYENGPLISFVAIPKRVLGDYHVELATQDGIDQLAKIDSFHIDHFHFDDDNEYIGGDGGFQVYFTDTTKEMFSIWALQVPSKEQIDLSAFGCFLGGTGTPLPLQPLPGFVSDGTCSENLWSIKKLTNSQMWIEITKNDIRYEVHLKKF